MSRPHPAAVARNWRTVIGFDVLLGLTTVVVGVVLAIGSHRGVGIVLALLGTLYVALVVLRGRKWARMRREAQSGD